MLPGISFLFIIHGIINSVNIIYKSIANLSFGYVQILSLQWIPTRNCADKVCYLYTHGRYSVIGMKFINIFIWTLLFNTLEGIISFTLTCMLMCNVFFSILNKIQNTLFIAAKKNSYLIVLHLLTTRLSER